MFKNKLFFIPFVTFLAGLILLITVLYSGVEAPLHSEIGPSGSDTYVLADVQLKAKGIYHIKSAKVTFRILNISGEVLDEVTKSADSKNLCEYEKKVFVVTGMGERPIDVESFVVEVKFKHGFPITLMVILFGFSAGSLVYLLRKKRGLQKSNSKT